MKWILALVILGFCTMVSAEDHVVTKATYESYSMQDINREVTLEAGEKLADIPAVQNFAMRTVPQGYKVTMRVHISVDVEKTGE